MREELASINFQALLILLCSAYLSCLSAVVFTGNVAFTGGRVLTLTVVFRRCWTRVVLIRLRGQIEQSRHGLRAVNARVVATVSVLIANPIQNYPVCPRCNM